MLPKYHSFEYWTSPKEVRDAVDKEYFDKKNQDLGRRLELSRRSPEEYQRKYGAS